MKGLHKNQQRILEHLLKNSDGATLDELSDHLGITKTAVKEHLIKIDEYISHNDTRGAVGRPRRRYHLSPEGHEVFPRQYSWLSNVLLELLAEDLGPEQVRSLMQNLATKVAKSMESRFQNKKNTPALLSEITKVLNELGYRASLKQSDVRKGAVLEATNCVYHSVAKQHPQLCHFDVQFIKNASQLDVKLESCIAKGGSVCRFCIRKNAS
jgi:DeoR family transcriptional regulator, suf operon transcriptional repressor